MKRFETEEYAVVVIGGGGLYIMLFFFSCKLFSGLANSMATRSVLDAAMRI